MARIPGVSPQQVGPEVADTLRSAREMMAQLAGRPTERGAEPVELLAHAPELLRGILAHQQAAAEAHRVPTQLKHLAELKAAALTNCEYCIDLNSQMSRRAGLSDEVLLALPFYKTSPLFTEREKLVLDYAVAATRTPVEVPDELFARLREHFDEAQIVELTHAIALENLYARFNLALGIAAAGFSEGMVCAVPERA
ncbi:MAG TPA: carboxymuconolactone decarboxylase family protein [Chloroflexota bacterium]|nr:carboxymuconolactone decarboxylase family protein [Chloroflexota bacterium]